MNEPKKATRANKLTLVKENIRHLHVQTDVQAGAVKGGGTLKLGNCSFDGACGSVVKNM